MPDFEPYILSHGMGELDFLVATPLAREWYDPPKPYTLLEYHWVLDHIPLSGKRIIDGGCHHGHYSLVLGLLMGRRLLESYLTMVDVHSSNLDIAEINMALNYRNGHLVSWCDYGFKQAALWKENGTVHYNGESNGELVSEGIPVEAIRLQDIDPKAEVVKLDIEGAEYAVIPDALGSMKIESWIIECHPPKQDELARQLADHGYELHWVNRAKLIVEPYELGTIWPGHSTLFARR